MAGSLTTSGSYPMAKKILDHVLGNTEYTVPGTVYLALVEGETGPGETGSMTNETAYTNYARRPITFAAASGRSCSMDADVTFATCGATGGTIKHWAICASGTATTDDVIAYGPFGTEKVVSTGKTPFVSFESNEITVTIADSATTGGMYTSFATTVLDWLFNGGILAQPTEWWIALHSDACLDTAPGTELTDVGYGRIPVTSGWDAASAANPSVADNTADESLQAASGAWTAATHASLYDAETVGNEMFWIDTPNLTVGSGEYARFLAGSFDITMT